VRERWGVSECLSFEGQLAGELVSRIGVGSKSSEDEELKPTLEATRSVGISETGIVRAQQRGQGTPKDCLLAP